MKDGIRIGIQMEDGTVHYLKVRDKEVVILRCEQIAHVEKRADLKIWRKMIDE